MSGQQTVSLKLTKAAGARLRDQLADAGFTFGTTPPHAAWQARGDAIATLYNSGKLVLQGQHVEAWVFAAEALGGVVKKRSGGAPADVPSGGRAASNRSLDGEPFAAGLAQLPSPAPDAWIGIDETGKGDYFGPLVVVAARVERSQLPLLAELGAADSKTLTDKRIARIAPDIARVVAWSSVVIMPERYNALYADIGNLNQLLAWAHATAAEDLLEKGATAELILSDQFSKANLVQRKLKPLGKALRYQQRTKAEDDPAVACASILARAEFVRRMDMLSESAGVRLPKGAGSPVLAAGRELVARDGIGALRGVAKLHFKTTQQLQ